MNKYISLAGGLVMIFLFTYTIKITLENPSVSNILISLAFLVFAFFGLKKYFMANANDYQNGIKNKKKEEYTPID